MGFFQEGEMSVLVRVIQSLRTHSGNRCLIEANGEWFINYYSEAPLQEFFLTVFCCLDRSSKRRQQEEGRDSRVCSIHHQNYENKSPNCLPSLAIKTIPAVLVPHQVYILPAGQLATPQQTTTSWPPVYYSPPP
jgi:hypothetical protein